ncbi:hypothetical protein EV702DRAFT_1050176 [Suillus placidus]|uniref:Uncharacterized protein n=1 Tax=Suillus placidus TaxID=48579 RepID=A0A9P6ZJL2_9AGAM|nr:hypothetical protein EV702DRAFT_1050176 [Suillus placidus]
MSTIFNGDSQMEVITVLANCGTDTDKARQALTRYIERKQEKGRSTEHILKKVQQLELKVGGLEILPSPPSFINDTTLHAAFRDARASTCLPRSLNIPLPDFVVRETAAKTRRDNRRSASASRDFATPSPRPSTPQSCLQPSYSPVQHVNSGIIEEDHIQPEEASYKAYEASLRGPSPTNAPGRLPVLSPYPSPRTPEIVPPFSSQSTAIIRDDISYPPRKEENSPQQPLVIVEPDPSETYIPSMFLPSREGSFNASESSGGDFPIPYRDSPILRERPASHDNNFSFPLDNALRLCAASPVVRHEVTQCLQQDQGYGQHNWPMVLQACGIAEDDIPFLLNEMAREVEFTNLSDLESVVLLGSVLAMFGSAFCWLKALTYTVFVDANLNAKAKIDSGATFRLCSGSNHLEIAQELVTEIVQNFIVRGPQCMRHKGLGVDEHSWALRYRYLPIRPGDAAGAGASGLSPEQGKLKQAIVDDALMMMIMMMIA